MQKHPKQLTYYKKKIEISQIFSVDVLKWDEIKQCIAEKVETYICSCVYERHLTIREQPFVLEKFGKTAELHCAVFPRKHTYPVLHTKVYSNHQMQLSFSKEKPQDTENDSSCIESGLHGQITSTLGTHEKVF